MAVTSDKHTVHVFNLDRKQTQAIPALDQGDGQANGEQSPKNPISALSFVSVSLLRTCMVSMGFLASSLPSLPAC